MKDRFRYKFWDKTTEFMGDVVSFDIESDLAMVRFSYADKETPDDEVDLSKGVLMQCTGLKDKNGELIYEGDIYKSCSYEKIRIVDNKSFKEYSETIGTVEWVDDGFYMIIRSQINSYFGELPSTKQRIYTENGIAVYDEIIGNKYENPELLKND